MPTKLAAAAVQLSDDYEELYDEVTRRGWGDGLPIVPPTRPRIERMLAATDLTPDHVIGEMPPRRADLTVELLAINAVMAGCLPDYFPVVVAIAEVIVQPEFNLFALCTTTNPVTECVIVNGPVRHQLDINSRYGFLGPGWRANATIGRAIKLTERNVGGTIPGKVSKATGGQPGRYGNLVFGEVEERSPWAPLHTTRGFEATDSTVTVYPAVSRVNISNQDAQSAKAILNHIHNSLTPLGSNTYNMGGNDMINPSLIVLCPDHANLIGRVGGMSREEVQRYLLAHARRPFSDIHPQYQDKVRKQKNFRDGYVYLHNTPEQFLLAVAGGDGGQTVYFSNFGDIGRTITWPIRLKGDAKAQGARP